MRRYYLHTRHSGVIYAEIVDPQTGAKLNARSTGTKNRDEALLIIAEWLKSGIPTGRMQKSRTLVAAAGIENILKAIRRTSELNSDDALRIVRALKDRDLIDIAAVKSGKGSVLFTEFLEEFWDYKESYCCTAENGTQRIIRECGINRLAATWTIVLILIQLIPFLGN